MEVTKTNFESVLKEIETLLPSSLFVSIDLEFTGLKDNSYKNGKRYSLNKYDLPSQRYMKQRQMIRNFAMIQLGICLWKYDDNDNDNDNDNDSQIIAHPFNFYTFPQNGSNSLFLSSSSSLLFLRQNGFDFNKLIDGGIDFLSIDKEKRKRENYSLNEKKKQQRIQERKKNKTIIKPKTENDKQFIKDIEIKLNEFVDKKDEEILKLGLLNRFKRLLIYQLIDQKYNQQLVAFKLSDNESNNNSYSKNIAIKKINDYDSKKKIEDEAKQKIDQEWNNNITNSIGVRKIFDLITKYKINVLLHNGFLDSMHLFRSFIGDLPLNPCKMTQRLHQLLPRIFDTKFIMKHLFKDKEISDNFSLSACFKFFINNDNINKHLKINVCINNINNNDNQRDLEKEKSYLTCLNVTGDGTENIIFPFHDAAFDSFATGFIFANIAIHLYLLNIDNMDKKNIFNVKDEFHTNNIKEMVNLSYFVNRLNLSQNYNKYFYIGDKYKLNNKFNLNLKFEDNENNNNDNNIHDLDIFCGTDFNAINDDWYKMFYCTIIDNDNNNDNNQEIIDLEKEIKEWFKNKGCIEDENRICIYKRSEINAAIKIQDINQKEYDQLLKLLDSNQDKTQKIKLIQYIHHKSYELKQQYQQIFDSKNNSDKSEKFDNSNNQNITNNNHNKKRNLNEIEEVSTNHYNEPPSKKQRIDSV